MISLFMISTLHLGDQIKQNEIRVGKMRNVCRGLLGGNLKESTTWNT